ncbi:MAG: radical SAM protein [Candidatus Competibacteraceae bacterium]|nr:radical SAM protein [Candidatus Competibacteraceae bacterium]
MNGSAADYDALWAKNVGAARQAGIQVTAIAVPNADTIKVGVERFYQHFVEQLGITDFQVNTPFPGGEPNETKENLSLDIDQLGQFYVDLAQIWLQHGYRNNVRIGPFDALLDYFTEGAACLPCIWRQNCADEFICIDAKGAVAQCDCWVTSYPEYWFGNLFRADSLADLLKTSKARQHFKARPKQLMQQGECIDCEYLALCHGGCPVRTYTLRNTLTEKDPYCELYQTLFQHMEKGSRQISSARH